MLVFISYPRELENFAKILEIDLNNLNIKTFLDNTDIPLSSAWKVEIENNIEKADIFVVLYLAVDSSRFFSTEIKRIERKCKGSNTSKVITVVFSPTKFEDLPPYFKSHQHISASRNENECHQWIDSVLSEIKKSNELMEKKGGWKSRISFLFFATMLLLSFILITELFEKNDNLAQKDRAIFILDDEKEKIESAFENVTNELNELKMSLKKSPKGESVCKSLLGNYELDHEYIFSWDLDTKSIAAHDTTWQAIECVYNKDNDFYILRGTDKTNFDVETIINGKYVRISTVPLVYESEVHINNSDGRLVDRIFNAVVPPEEVPLESITLYPKGKRKELTEALDTEFISKKTYEVLRNRYELHRKIRPKGCSPMLGYVGIRTAISFVCPHYTRVMVKQSNDLIK